MWRSKKFVIIAVLAAVVLAGTLGGVALAQTGDEASPPKIGTLLEKVAGIYQANTGTAIDAAELQKAFEQAGKELAAGARDSYLQKLVEDGKLTQEQADQYKGWLDSKPDVPFAAGPRAHMGRGGFGAFGGMFGGWCQGAPQNS